MSKASWFKLHNKVRKMKENIKSVGIHSVGIDIEYSRPGKIYVEGSDVKISITRSAALVPYPDNMHWSAGNYTDYKTIPDGAVIDVQASATSIIWLDVPEEYMQYLRFESVDHSQS